MSDLVGNPEDRFSRIAALIGHALKQADLDIVCVYTLQKLAHAINRDFLSFKN